MKTVELFEIVQILVNNFFHLVRQKRYRYVFMVGHFLFLLLLLFSMELSAVEQGNSCFQISKNKLFQIYPQMKFLNLDDKKSSLEKSCEELKEAKNYLEKGLVEEAKDDLTNFFYDGLTLGNAASAFSKLNGTTIERKYMDELEKIKLIPDRMERINRVFLLSTKYQGFYDFKDLGRRTDINGNLIIGPMRPENLLEMSQKEGSIGVCRHFAALLTWSLLQVSRYKDSTGSALTENDFSATYVGGKLTKKPHAWVRVNLPYKRADGRLDFYHFDLDPTWNSDRFVPLMTRRSGLTEKKRSEMLQECQRISSCLDQKIEEERIEVLKKYENQVFDGERGVGNYKKNEIPSDPRAGLPRALVK